jgi:hypothetical protein
MLLAVLAARRYRRESNDRRARLWFVATAAAVLFALLSKEHAVVTVVFLGLDQYLDEEGSRRPTGELYVAVIAVTVGWLFLWRAVAGSYAGPTAAANFRGLSAGGRIATMLPVQLDVVRLLTWPLDLSHDYNPLVVPQRTALGVLAYLGAATAAAILAVGVACLKRAPAVAFGIIAGVATYAPTSNLVFASGVALAERSLYLAVLAPALAVGWVVAWALRARERRVVIMVAAALGGVYAVRTVTRTPFWMDTRTAVIEGVIHHPESFRNRVRVGRISELTGDSARGLAEYLVAGALFPQEPLVASLSVPLALAMGRNQVALREARRAHDLWPWNPGFIGLLIQAYTAQGDVDSATHVAETAVAEAPQSQAVARLYLEFLRAHGAAPWRVVLAEVRLDWLSFRLGAASRGLDSLAAALEGAPPGNEWCWELGSVWRGIHAMRPGLEERLEGLVLAAGLECGLSGLDPSAGAPNRSH